MSKSSWNNFVQVRDEFRRTTEKLSRLLPKLKKLQQELAGGKYKVENPVVYNTALDHITQDDDIKLILVADNPGRVEQAAEHRCYLVGKAGTTAEKFFSDNPILGMDLRKNVIILNKTQIHSASTGQLKMLGKKGGSPLETALKESQESMASLLLKFQKALDVPVWITGYSEMKKGGIFESYTETLKKLYADSNKLFEKVFLFQHFSRSCFTRNLKQQALADEPLVQSLVRIGAAHRERILGYTAQRH